MRAAETRRVVVRSLWAKTRRGLQALGGKCPSRVSLSLRSVWLSAAPWTAAHQAPLSAEILQARALGAAPCPPPGEPPSPGNKPPSPTLRADSSPSDPARKPKNTAVGGQSAQPGNGTGVSSLQADSLPGGLPGSPLRAHHCLYKSSLYFPGFPGGSDSKASACSAGDPGLIPGPGRPPGEGNGTHSSPLAWKIPWTEGPARLQSMGWQRAGHAWATSFSLSLHFLPVSSLSSSCDETRIYLSETSLFCQYCNSHCFLG